MLFNSAIDKHTFMEIGKEYVFSDGSIRPARTQDQFHRHPYQINMDDKGGTIKLIDSADKPQPDSSQYKTQMREESSGVGEGDSDQVVPCPSFNFASIKDVALMPSNSKIDFIGILL